MGFFDRRKRDREQRGELRDQLGRNRDLGQQLAEQSLAAVGMTLADARQAAATATAPGAMAAMITYRDRAIRLTQHGIELPGTLTSLEPEESSPLYGGTMARLTLSVEPPGGARYDASVDQILAGTMVATLKVGDRVTVKADPDDPQSVMLWGAPAQPGPGGSESRIARLEQLQRLHEQGLLSDEEFQAQKAKILQG